MRGLKMKGIIVGLLLCLASSIWFASQLWTWVLDFDPGFAFSHPPAKTGAPITSGVTILLIDGLRLDASRGMPTLNALRARGADIEAQVGTPSFSRPGRATIVVGAPPAIHGVTSNRQKRALKIDNLFRAVSAIGGTCRVFGSSIWASLFSEDINRCGVYLHGEGKEGPGTFAADIPKIRESHAEGVAFVLEKPASLRIADIVATDFAAHEYGGGSPEYAAEVARTDATLADLLTHLDLSKETLIVTADHGHRDAGGHGGDEPEVLAIPIVMVGAGVRPGSTAKASQADIAPTVAALLGADEPRGASGHPLTSVLMADGVKGATIRAADVAQSAGFEKALIDRLGARRAPESGRRDWQALTGLYRMDGLLRRIPLAAGLGVLTATAAAFFIFGARPAPRAWMVGLAVGALVFAGPIRWMMPLMSFSGINYDEMLIPFFVRIMELAALNSLIAIAAGLLVWRSSGIPRTSSAASVAGSIGLGCSAVLAVGLIVSWLHDGLLMPFALPGPNQMVLAYATTLSLLSVSATGLIVVSVLAVSEKLRH